MTTMVINYIAVLIFLPVLGSAVGILSGLYLFVYLPYKADMKKYKAVPRSFWAILLEVLK